MITKIFKYKIKNGTEKTYLEMQESVQKLYREYAEVDFSYLKDPKNNTLRTEVIRFFDSNAAAFSKFES
jgi:antibiotic biosynthesis monooxygenase (ABM) superfamily enzyme